MILKPVSAYSLIVVVLIVGSLHSYSKPPQEDLSSPKNLKKYERLMNEYVTTIPQLLADNRYMDLFSRSQFSSPQEVFDYFQRDPERAQRDIGAPADFNHLNFMHQHFQYYRVEWVKYDAARLHFLFLLKDQIGQIGFSAQGIIELLKLVASPYSPISRLNHHLHNAMIDFEDEVLLESILRSKSAEEISILFGYRPEGRYSESDLEKIIVHGFSVGGISWVQHYKAPTSVSVRERFEYLHSNIDFFKIFFPHNSYGNDELILRITQAILDTPETVLKHTYPKSKSSIRSRSRVLPRILFQFLKVMWQRAIDINIPRELTADLIRAGLGVGFKISMIPMNEKYNQVITIQDFGSSLSAYSALAWDLTKRVSGLSSHRCGQILVGRFGE